MRAVAGAIVAAVFAGIGDGYTSQMCAHSQHDDPAGVDDSVLIMLRVSQLCEADSSLGSDFLLCAVTNKQWFASPLEGHVLAFRDVTQFDFYLGHS